MTLIDLKNRIDGPVFTIFTSFNDDLSIDYESIDRYIQYLYDGGARIFYVMPYNSRYSQLSEKEIYDLNEFLYKISKIY